jgi:enoyl-CoA hydratase/carnithine racemase
MSSAVSGDGALLVTASDGPVRTISFNRPHRLNAMTIDSYRALHAELSAARGDGSVRAVVLRGEGKAFCSGADLKELPGTDRAALAVAFRDLVTGLITFPKPLIAAVRGVAVGFGMTMLLTCDLVVMADTARMRAPFTQLGTVPEAASSWLLPRLVGAQRAADIMLTSRWIGGPEALACGLAAASCPDGEVDAAATATAVGLARHDPRSVAATKALLRHDWAAEADRALSRELTAVTGLRPVIDASKFTED